MEICSWTGNLSITVIVKIDRHIHAYQQFTASYLPDVYLWIGGGNPHKRRAHVLHREAM